MNKILEKKHEEFGERLKKIRESLGFSVEKISKIVQEKSYRIRDIEKGKQKCPSKVLTKYVKNLQVNPNWLLTGQGPMFLEEKTNSWEEEKTETITVREDYLDYAPRPKTSCSVPKQLLETINVNNSSYYLIPKVKARLSAGTGSLETDGNVIERYAFRADWVHSFTTSPKSLILMDVFGDSMEPEIKNGDTVMIDTSQTETILGKIYAVAFGEEIAIKTLDKEPGKIILRSINKNYDPIYLPETEWADRVKIIGKIIWWCREAK